MDHDFLFPDENILLIEFMKLQEFYSYSFMNHRYEIIGKDDVGNLVGRAENTFWFAIVEQMELEQL